MDRTDVNIPAAPRDVLASPRDLPAAPPGAVLVVPWRSVRPMPGQPREFFDATALESLARSIRAVGQLVPAQVVRLVGPARRDDVRSATAPASSSPASAPVFHDYELIDGQRRWHAVQLAGLPTLRVEIIDEPDPGRRYVRSVASNFGREGHHPIEIATALGRLRGIADPASGRPMTLEKIAEVVGHSYDYVQKYLTLLHLGGPARARLHPTAPRSQRLPVAAAFELARLTHESQAEALRRIDAEVGGGLSALRATRKVLASMTVMGAGAAEAGEDDGGAAEPIAVFRDCDRDGDRDGVARVRSVPGPQAVFRPGGERGRPPGLLRVKRSPYQEYAAFLGMLRRVVDDMEGAIPAAREMVVRRPAGEVAVVAGLLGRAREAVGKIEYMIR